MGDIQRQDPYLLFLRPWTQLSGERARFFETELARELAVRGADLIVIPSAWAAGLLKEEHWVTLVRARAIENTIWVAAAGQVPDPDEPPTTAATGVGRSMLVDPMGTVRLDLGSGPEVATGTVDTDMTARVRAVLPCLQHRRPEIFAATT